MAKAPKISNRRLAFLLVPLLSLAGCSSKPEAGSALDTSIIEKQMLLTAKAVAESKQIRARSENALRLAALSEEEKERYKQVVAYIPPGLDLPLSYNERIEADRILKLIAQMTRWEFDVRGRVPVNGAMVYVNRETTPAYDLIIDIESQIKDRAKIVLIEYPKGSPMNGMIVLEFKETNL